MTRKGIRGITGAGLTALAIWWLRLLAHSKKPPPEGHWRELDLRRDP